MRVRKPCNSAGKPTAWCDEAGQSLVELTLGMIVLLILLLGVLDVGRLFFTLVALQNAAGEGALYASAFPTCKTAANCADPNNVEYRVKQESSTGVVDWSTASIAVEPNVPVTGGTITVTVTYNHKLLTPFISQMIGGGILPLRARASQRVIGAP